MTLRLLGLEKGHSFWRVQPKNRVLFIGKMVGKPLGWRAPSCLTHPRSPLKADMPNKYQLYKVYMGLIIESTIPRVFPPFFL